MSDIAKYNGRAADQAGMASIIITIVIMLVLSLIVIGFAKISRREQRSSLDRELSTQAFYAAETGVNDAIAFFNAGTTTNQAQYKSDCNAYIKDKDLTPTIDTQAGVKYTCLLVNPEPTSLVCQDVGNDPCILPLNATSTINSVTFTWETPPFPAAPVTLDGCPPNGNSKNLPPFHVPTQAGDWSCVFPLASVDLAPTPAAGFTRDALSQNTMTGYFTPTSAASGVTSYQPNRTGPQAAPAIYPASCNTTVCSATITGLGGLNEENFFIKVRMLYGETSKLTVCAFSSAGASSCTAGNPLALNGAQLLIDSTGQASDVLRRIQVRANVGETCNPGNTSCGSAIVPDYAIQTKNSLCKQFEFIPGNGDINLPINLAPDPACGIVTAPVAPVPPSPPPTGGGGGGLGSGSGSPGVATENAFKSYYNDSDQGYPLGRVPISCFYDWGDGSPHQSISITACESYATNAAAGAAGALVAHNYCKQANGGLPPDPGSGAVDCTQLPACPPGPPGSPFATYPANNSYFVTLHITDVFGGAIIPHTTNSLPVCG